MMLTGSFTEHHPSCGYDKDDVMIEGLFYACDVNNQGSVSVSSLIDYLANNNSSGPDSEESLLSLEKILNPEGDPEKCVELIDCKEGLRQWIKDIRNSSENSYLEDVLGSPAQNSPVRSKILFNDSFRCTSEKIFMASPLLNSLDLSRMSLDNSVLETSNRLQEQEISDMLGKIADLQHQNKKLIEENSKLQQQLDVQEENVASMALGNIKLEKKLKGVQTMLEERNEVLTENEDLKISLAAAIDARKRLDDHVHQLEKDYQTLEKELADSDLKVHQLVSQVEEQQLQHAELNRALAQQKEVNSKMTEIAGFHEAQLSEKTQKIAELDTYISNLEKMTEDMRADNSGLQQELIQAQQDIFSLQSGGIKTEESDSADMLSEASISLPIEGEVTPPSCTLPSSTPLRTGSIHTELRGILSSSLHLPSPLCNKELTDSVMSLDDGSMDDMTPEDLDLSSVLESYNGQNLLQETTKLANKRREKQDEFLREMDDLLNSEPEADTYRGSNSIDSSESVSLTVDMRVKQLVDMIKKLKCENERLKTLHEETVETLLSSDKAVDLNSDSRLTVLRDVMMEERALRTQVEIKIKCMKKTFGEELCFAVEEKSAELKSLSEIKEALEVENVKLKRSNLDLAEKCHKSELRTTELQDQLQESDQSWVREKKRCSDLEENLTKSKKTRQKDLHDIWRIVQRELNNEVLDDQKDNCSNVSASTDCLKDQIAKEIENLKGRLSKRQAALGALKGRQLCLPLKPIHLECGDTIYHPQDSPSSPLVEALTIDFFNGNVAKSSTTVRPATFSSFDAASLQRINCEACMKHAGLSSNTSCPSLHHTTPGDVGRYTASTSNLNVARVSHSNLNTSSSSSTSGVDVSPRRTRSIHGQIKRRSFIRHSSRYKTDTTPGSKSENELTNQQTYPHEIQPIEKLLAMDQLNVDSPSAFRRSSYTKAIENQCDSNVDDNIQPLMRDRSLSFQAAIEHGQRSPDSAMELTQSLDMSDTSDYQDYKYDSFSGQSCRSDSGVKTEVKSVSFDMGSEQEYDEQVECTSENISRPTPTAHRKLSILQEEECENHADQNGNVIMKNNDTTSSPKSKCVDQEDQAMEGFHGNIVRKSPTTKYDERREAISVGLTRDDLLAHLKKNSDGHTIPNSFPPKLHRPNSVEKNNNEENVKDGETSGGEKENGLTHIFTQEEEQDNITHLPNIVPSRLSQIRESNLAKKRDQMKSSKLPELPEQGEMSTTRVDTKLPEDFDETMKPPPASNDEVTPSIPDSFLEKLGLKVGKNSDKKNLTSADNLPEKEVENKFNALALAFRTDRLTLDKRLEIQERARDISEQNVDQELHGLREAVEYLNKLCSDIQIREVITKIKNHIDVLEQCAARVSSRAEVLGAVQQEKRMCRAMEVMMVHVDNQKRLYEKDHADLEEARKVLQDRPFGSMYGDAPSDSRRSMSVCAANGAPRIRRRSDVALPRVLGGRGCPLLVHSSSMDAKQRFQSVVANTTMKNAVTTVIRRASMEKMANFNPSPSSRPSSRESSIEVTTPKEVPKTPSKQTSQEEEAYQKGFEDGVKMKISKDLGDLREQQNTVSSTLENIMDKVEQTKEEEENDKKNNEQLKEALLTKIKMLFPNKEEVSHRLRLTLAGIIFIFAVLTVIFTLMPSSVAALEIFADVKHLGTPPL